MIVIGADRLALSWSPNTMLARSLLSTIRLPWRMGPADCWIPAKVVRSHKAWYCVIVWKPSHNQWAARLSGREQHSRVSSRALDAAEDGRDGDEVDRDLRQAAEHDAISLPVVVGEVDGAEQQTTDSWRERRSTGSAESRICRRPGCSQISGGGRDSNHSPRLRLPAALLSSKLLTGRVGERIETVQR